MAGVSPYNLLNKALWRNIRVAGSIILLFFIRALQGLLMLYYRGAGSITLFMSLSGAIKAIYCGLGGLIVAYLPPLTLFTHISLYIFFIITLYQYFIIVILWVSRVSRKIDIKIKNVKMKKIDSIKTFFCHFTPNPTNLYPIGLVRASQR